MIYFFFLSLYKEKLFFILCVVVFCIFMVGIICVFWLEFRNIVLVFIVVSIVDFWFLIVIIKVVLNVGVVDYLRNSLKVLFVILVCGVVLFVIMKFLFLIMSEWVIIFVVGIMFLFLWLVMMIIIKYILLRVIFEFIY